MSDQFVTLDSGQRQEFDTGARRDTDEGKPQFTLLPVSPLTRLTMLYVRGLVKYGRHNWQKGMPFSRTMDSLLRHAFAYLDGDRTEDHLAAIAFNAFAIMFYEDEIKKNKLPAELDDLTPKSEVKVSSICKSDAEIKDIKNKFKEATVLNPDWTFETVTLNAKSFEKPKSVNQHPFDAPSLIYPTQPCEYVDEASNYNAEEQSNKVSTLSREELMEAISAADKSGLANLKGVQEVIYK